VEKVNSILSRVEEPSELDSGDYVVAVTSDLVYVDRVDDVVAVGAEYDLTLQDGVLEPDHSHLDVPHEVPTQNHFDSNDVLDIYRVAEGSEPDQAYSENSFIGAFNRLTS